MSEFYAKFFDSRHASDGGAFSAHSRAAVRSRFRSTLFLLDSHLRDGHSPLVTGILMERTLYQLVSFYDAQPIAHFTTSLDLGFSLSDRALLTLPARYWVFVLEQHGVRGFFAFIAEDILVLTGRRPAQA